MNVNEISKRLDQFCLEYKIPKRFHGSLRLLSDMAFALGAEIEPRAIQPRKEHEALQEGDETLQADKEKKLREALRRISIGDGIGGPDAELQCADIARAALQETER